MQSSSYPLCESYHAFVGDKCPGGGVSVKRVVAVK